MWRKGNGCWEMRRENTPPEASLDLFFLWANGDEEVGAKTFLFSFPRKIRLENLKRALWWSEVNTDYRAPLISSISPSLESRSPPK